MQTIQDLADQLNTSVANLLQNLANAGFQDKRPDDVLAGDEKIKLLQFMRGDNARSAAKRRQITLKRKTTDQIKQTSKTGAARTVHVETKKKRTFIKRTELEIKTANEAAKRADLEIKRRAELAARQESAAAEPSSRARSPDTAAPPAADAKREPTTAADPRRAEKITEPNATVARDPRDKAGAEPRKKPKKNKKGASAGAKGGRVKLHVPTGRGKKTRRKPFRKIGKISTALSEEHGFARPTKPIVREVQIGESIRVGDLAQAMSVKAGDIIKLMMEMGTMATINQLLDRDTAVLLVEEMGHTPKLVAEADPESLLQLRDEQGGVLRPRPPVVTVMGHVDHGKTTLLDYFRNSKIAAGEAGGITQHIGAYKVRLPKGEICFLDTPGHEAFSAMRVRGAQVTDLVILVVAADDGVKPQTVEAIRHARAAEAPLIVAINKVDLEQAEAERVRRELTAHGVIAENLGGDVLMNEVSAATGQGMDALLESVLLQSEVLDLRARDHGPARGQVVEARLDKGRGAVATVLVRQGILRTGDIILAGRETGRARVLMDDQGRRVQSARPSTPVEIQGLSGVPVAGDDFFSVEEERVAREIALHRQMKYKEGKLAARQKIKLDNMFNRLSEAPAQALNLLIKADVQGSVEALTEAMENMSIDECQVKVVHGMVGGINESDVNLALAADARIVAFNVRADAAARKLIENENVEVQYHNIIYDVVNSVKAFISGMLAPTISERPVGLVEVREVFRAPKIGAVAGGYVLEGSIKRNLPVRVLRDNIVIFQGAIDSLRRFKEDVQEVKSGLECGVGIKNYKDVKAGDQIEVYEVVESAANLDDKLAAKNAPAKKSVATEAAAPDDAAMEANTTGDAAPA